MALSVGHARKTQPITLVRVVAGSEDLTRSPQQPVAAGNQKGAHQEGINGDADHKRKAKLPE